MTALVLYALLSTAMWYLGSRALITSAIWSRYPPRFASFMDCSACTGFWWGYVFAFVVGRHADLLFIGLPADAPYTPFVVGLCMIAIVPIGAGLMQWGLWQAGSATNTYDVGAIDTTDDD